MSKQEEQSKWKIDYWCNENDESAVEEWLDGLTNEQLKSVAKELRLLELCGNMLRLPHSRSLTKGLFELRERRYGYRVYYTFQSENRILMLHAGNKDTQEKDIKIARKRLDELSENEGG